MATVTLMSLPAELRNQIYGLVWEETQHEPLRANNTTPERLALLLVCRQLRDEASLLALNKTTFHLRGQSALPEHFLTRIKQLSPGQIKSIRTLTLTAKITHLRALNETWQGLPFGHPLLSLDRLIIVPMKPDVSTTCYAEVADLSQCHVLAYVLTETLKSLKNLRIMEVHNVNCFNDHIWKLLYRGLLYQLVRWGGNSCGMRFVASKDCFRILIGEDWDVGHEGGSELARLMD